MTTPTPTPDDSNALDVLRHWIRDVAADPQGQTAELLQGMWLRDGQGVDGDPARFVDWLDRKMNERSAP
jgi:hypothetical protein